MIVTLVPVPAVYAAVQLKVTGVLVIPVYTALAAWPNVLTWLEAAVISPVTKPAPVAIVPPPCTVVPYCIIGPVPVAKAVLPVLAVYTVALCTTATFPATAAINVCGVA